MCARRGRCAVIFQEVFPSESVRGALEAVIVTAFEAASKPVGRCASRARLARELTSAARAYCPWHFRLMVRESVDPVCPSAGK